MANACTSHKRVNLKSGIYWHMDTPMARDTLYTCTAGDQINYVFGSKNTSVKSQINQIIFTLHNSQREASV